MPATLSTRPRRLALVALAALTISSLSPFVSAAPQKDKHKSKSDKSAASKVPANAPAAAGKPTLWTDRGTISSLDLYWGIGGSDQNAPKPPFTFVKEDLTGTNPKIKVTDANGVKWNVKFDEEVHAEVACSRIAWAAGYMVEESYFVPSAKISGVTGLGRAKKFVGSDGSISNAMFEKRPDTIARRATPWSWDSNPFSGTKELSGLAILAVMLNDWDAKQDNNNVLGMYADDGSTVQDWYCVADWGGTLGKMGGVFSHSKWDVDAYNKQPFIEGVSGNMLRLAYHGKGGNILQQVPVEHARWFAGVVGQLTDEQLRQAFKASGATDTETTGFTTRIRQKINELKQAVGQQ